MYLILLWFVAVFGCGAGKGIPTEEADSVSFAIPEEELNYLRNVSQKIEIFLNREADGEYQKLINVSVQSGMSDESESFDSNSPVESLVLPNQMTLHRDVEEMLKEWKAFFSRLTIPKHRQKRDGTKPQMEPEGLHRPAPKNKYSPTDVAYRPEDCSELLVRGETKSGVYDIYPFRCQCSPPVKVMCDMDTDGGGWNVILARQNQSKPLNFTQNWQTYKKGFGSPEGEYWLGNEIIHILTSGRKYVLRLEAKDGFGREVWGEWNDFSVDSEKEKYKLTAVDPNADNRAYDAFTVSSGHNGNYFSTFDFDNDKHKTAHCSELCKGGWWYSNCVTINPTGIMGATGTTSIYFAQWSKKDTTTRHATWLQLKIRPKICSDQIPVAKLNTHNCVSN